MPCKISGGLLKQPIVHNTEFQTTMVHNKKNSVAQIFGGAVALVALAQYKCKFKHYTDISEHTLKMLFYSISRYET